MNLLLVNLHALHLPYLAMIGVMSKIIGKHQSVIFRHDEFLVAQRIRNRRNGVLLALGRQEKPPVHMRAQRQVAQCGPCAILPDRGIRQQREVMNRPGPVATAFTPINSNAPTAVHRVHVNQLPREIPRLRHRRELGRIGNERLVGCVKRAHAEMQSRGENQ